MVLIIKLTTSKKRHNALYSLRQVFSVSFIASQGSRNKGGVYGLLLRSPHDVTKKENPLPTGLIS